MKRLYAASLISLPPADRFYQKSFGRILKTIYLDLILSP